MTKSFFSPLRERTSKNLANQLEVILNEQRHQRGDLAAILYLLKSIKNDFRLSSSTAEYLEASDSARPQIEDLD